ncbi:unnamed protein product [Closterium sp. NIES-53]
MRSCLSPLTTSPLAHCYLPLASYPLPLAHCPLLLTACSLFRFAPYGPFSLILFFSLSAFPFPAYSTPALIPPPRFAALGFRNECRPTCFPPSPLLPPLPQPSPSSIEAPERIVTNLLAWYSHLKEGAEEDESSSCGSSSSGTETTEGDSLEAEREGSGKSKGSGRSEGNEEGDGGCSATSRLMVADVGAEMIKVEGKSFEVPQKSLSGTSRLTVAGVGAEKIIRGEGKSGARLVWRDGVRVVENGEREKEEEGEEEEEEGEVKEVGWKQIARYMSSEDGLATVGKDLVGKGKAKEENGRKEEGKEEEEQVEGQEVTSEPNSPRIIPLSFPPTLASPDRFPHPSSSPIPPQLSTQRPPALLAPPHPLPPLSPCAMTPPPPPCPAQPWSEQGLWQLGLRPGPDAARLREVRLDSLNAASKGRKWRLVGKGRGKWGGGSDGSGSDAAEEEGGEEGEEDEEEEEGEEEVERLGEMLMKLEQERGAWVGKERADDGMMPGMVDEGEEEEGGEGAGSRAKPSSSKSSSDFKARGGTGDEFYRCGGGEVAGREANANASASTALTTARKGTPSPSGRPSDTSLDTFSHASPETSPDGTPDRTPGSTPEGNPGSDGSWSLRMGSESEEAEMPGMGGAEEEEDDFDVPLEALQSLRPAEPHPLLLLPLRLTPHTPTAAAAAAAAAAATAEAAEAVAAEVAAAAVAAVSAAGMHSGWPAAGYLPAQAPS